MKGLLMVVGAVLAAVGIGLGALASTGRLTSSAFPLRQLDPAGHVSAGPAFARAVLAKAVVPSGARPTSHMPPLLRRAPTPDEPGLVDLHRFYLAPGAPETVRSEVLAHRPAGARVSATSTFSDPTSEGIGFDLSLPTVGPHEYEATLAYELTALPGKEQSALRIDAETIWLPSLPARDHVPAPAQVTLLSDPAPVLPIALSPPPRLLVTRLSRGAGARVVSLLDGLPPSPPPACMEDAVLYRLQIVAEGHRYDVVGDECQAVVEIYLDGTPLAPRFDDDCALQRLIASVAPRGAAGTRQAATRCLPASRWLQSP